MITRPTKNQRVFTLIELLVVIAIIAVLAALALAALSSSQKRSRDSRRLSDMKQIQAALVQYRDDKGQYPIGDNQGCGTWEVTEDGDFITPLRDGGYLNKELLEPRPALNNSCGNYAYYRYPPNYAGCTNAFYVVGIRDLEGSAGPPKTSPGWKCPARDWQAEFDWVAGEFE